MEYSDKKELRREISRRIKEMTEAERLSQSLSVCKKILDTEEWAAAKNILLYEALPDEVNLSLLFEEAGREGKNVWSPAPTADAPTLPASILQELDLIVVPGRAFTLDGDRLGRGKGYYDRLLAQTSCPTISPAFDCQLFHFLPTDPWDRKIGKVIV